MPTIKISDSTYSAFCKRGKFGETADTVLRRILRLPSTEAAKDLSLQQIHKTKPLTTCKCNGNITFVQYSSTELGSELWKCKKCGRTYYFNAGETLDLVAKNEMICQIEYTTAQEASSND